MIQWWLKYATIIEFRKENNTRNPVQKCRQRSPEDPKPPPCCVHKSVRKFRDSTRPGQHTKSYWTCPIIVDLPTRVWVVFHSDVNVYRRVQGFHLDVVTLTRKKTKNSVNDLYIQHILAAVHMATGQNCVHCVHRQKKWMVCKPQKREKQHHFSETSPHFSGIWLPLNLFLGKSLCPVRSAPSTLRSQELGAFLTWRPAIQVLKMSGQAWWTFHIRF